VHRLEVTSERGPYPVLVGAGLLDEIDEVLVRHRLARPGSLVSNETVSPLYGRPAADRLALAPPIELPDGERFKRWAQVERLCAAWLEGGLTRRDLVVAVGGGVVTDLVGFAAAVYLRGIDWVAVPTTLLAMVDASVGGKTGVNLDQGKNLVGAFWPPRLVAADVAALASLDERQLRAGMAEVIKAAWLGDPSLLDLVEAWHAAPRVFGAQRWSELVARSVAVKVEVVEADERESGRRQALNLGHTLGHALEAATGYHRFVHGEAVAWGLRAVIRISVERGLLGPAAAARLDAATTWIEPLPPLGEVTPEVVLEHLVRDKKRDLEGVRWVLPTDDGVLLDQRVMADEVRRVLRQLATA
jgi:3-dehydroquinate synthase